MTKANHGRNAYVNGVVPSCMRVLLTYVQDKWTDGGIPRHPGTLLAVMSECRYCCPELLRAPICRNLLDSCGDSTACDGCVHAGALATVHGSVRTCIPAIRVQVYFYICM